MKFKCVVLLLFGLIGCGGQSPLENDAQRMLASVRDLEEELADLPQRLRGMEKSQQNFHILRQKKRRVRDGQCSSGYKRAWQNEKLFRKIV